MSSFYGGASIYGGGSGSGGSSNYDDLQNIPIKNATGTEDAPVNLDSLDYGSYLLDGNYIFKESETQTGVLRKTQISVVQDVVTQKKVVTYQYLQNGYLYARTITYEEDGSYAVSDICLASGSSPLIFIDDEEATTPAGSAPVITID